MVRTSTWNTLLKTWLFLPCLQPKAATLLDYLRKADHFLTNGLDSSLPSVLITVNFPSVRVSRVDAQSVITSIVPTSIAVRK
ncbi:hypothetical protein D3C79_891560 [compost metagenome]